MRATVTLMMLFAATTRADDGPRFEAGFAEVDVTPPLGTPRQGWNASMRAERVLDPIMARAAVFRRGDGPPLAILSLDIALIGAADAAAIRRRARAEHGVEPGRLLVAATHNHAGPAVLDEALPRDERWIEQLIAGATAAVGKAWASRVEAEVAVGSAFVFNVAANRRVLRRDGTARTHGGFRDPMSLAVEGPIDPELGVLAVRARAGGAMLGLLANYACHPTHHGGDAVFSAGYPGAFCRELRASGVPVALFLQGAAGNVAYDEPTGRPEKSMGEIGEILAGAALRAVAEARWSRPSTLDAASTTVSLRYREPTEAEIGGTSFGAQRLGEAGYYERKIPPLLAQIRRDKVEAAEVQALRIGDLWLASQPAETFVEHGLAIKRGVWPARAFVVGYAGGMLGYLPTEDAFAHGGYETTFGPPSRMAPEAGRLLAEAAVGMIRGR